MDTSTPATLSGQARESFFAAQVRHRAGARRWSLAAGAIVAVLALVIAMLLAPPAFVAIGLLLDVANLAVPTLDLFARAMDWGDRLQRAAGVPPAEIAAVLALVALPGLALLALGWWRLGRLAATHQQAALQSALGLRAPRGDDIEEIQLHNLVEEMAIAAGRSPPTLYLLDHLHCNLGLIGDDDAAAVFVTRGVLDRLGRDQTQALVAQLIAALGNGDGRMAERMLRLTEMVGLFMLLSEAPMSALARDALRPLIGLHGARKGEDAIAALCHVLSDPWSFTDRTNREQRPDRLTWRDYALMPLMGSVMIGLLIVPIVSVCLLAPLLGLAWRRRRFLADAMAVQFTRHPQALAEAYAALHALPTQLGLKVPWLMHLFALDVVAMDAMRLVSPYPRLSERVKRLNAQGAQVPVPVDRRTPLWVRLVMAPLIVVVMGLLGVLVYLATFLSIALNALFLLLPAGLLHVLLR